MDTIKFPSQHITNWSIPDVTSESGFRDQKELTGVILNYQDVRRFWHGKYGESDASAPDCISYDTNIGQGDPGGECEFCEFGNWQENEKDADKQDPPECKLSRDLLIMLPDRILPVNLSIGPGSYTNIKKYFIKLVSAGVPYWKAVSSISLSTAQAKTKKIDYPKASIRMLQLVEDDTAIEAIDSYRALLSKSE
jgi:hypothetical protein